MATAKNRYVFETKLQGFINVYEDSGKYNNRTFAYEVPQDVITQMEDDRVELLSWARTKSTGRVQEALEPWTEENVAKFTYGGETKKPEPIFVDTEGTPIDRAVLKDIRKGSTVKLIVQQKPYALPQKIGTSLRVLGVQVIELVTGNGAADSGDLSVSDVAALFGTSEGFKQGDPQVRDAREEEAPVAADGSTSYDF